jgi:glycosyltransferase involved in cell wall biosynthesis
LNILFIHKSFPGQFKYLSLVLSSFPNHNVTFITEDNILQLKGINKIVYKPEQIVSSNCHRYLRYYEKAVIVGEAVASTAVKLKDQGYKPDVIYGFSGWGATLFLKDIFPDVPLISYCEWFANADGPETAFDGHVFDEENRKIIRCGNSALLSDLCSCDAAITPTQWQKQQFPKEFHHKISVIHEGIDTETCKPDNNAKFLITDKGLVLSSKEEVITYGTRGMELYRGFPQFMAMVSKLQKKRPNVHIVVAGEDAIFYSPKLGDETCKESTLKKYDYDANRLHFVGTVSFIEYIKLLQISSVHVYLTYPYILSWSILNAMAAGCCIIASDTQPVLEVVKDNYNGLLFDFHNIEQLTQKVEYALDNRDKMQEIRNNARQTILDNYDLKKLLLQQITFIDSMIS